MTRQDLVNKSIDKLNTVKEALELIEILEYDECIAVLTGTKNLPYMVEMERLGYTNNFEVLDAREFGLPQARERVFTVSVLNGERFEFDDLIRTPMRNLQEFLEDDAT